MHRLQTRFSALPIVPVLTAVFLEVLYYTVTISYTCNEHIATQTLARAI